MLHASLPQLLPLLQHHCGGPQQLVCGHLLLTAALSWSCLESHAQLHHQHAAHRLWLGTGTQNTMHLARQQCCLAMAQAALQSCLAVTTCITTNSHSSLWRG